MKLEAILLFFFMFSATFCMAQSSVARGGNSVASSQIRVSIPSYAVITLAKNTSKSIAYQSSSDLKEIVQLNATTRVEANDKWSVNVVKDKNDIDTPVNKNMLSKSTPPTYTLIYVTTQI